MSSSKLVLILLELGWDYVTGKLDRKHTPVTQRSSGWTHVESEIKAKAQRCAGHESEPKCR